jgi:hypothetical protein
MSPKATTSTSNSKENEPTPGISSVFGLVDYVDHTDRSFKFPLLVSSSKDMEKPFLLLAEAIYSSAMTTPVFLLEKTNTLEEIVAAIKTKQPKRNESPTSPLFKSQHTTIVIHGITGATAFSPIVVFCLLASFSALAYWMSLSLPVLVHTAFKRSSGLFF